jgi:hypothetical protein
MSYPMLEVNPQAMSYSSANTNLVRDFEQDDHEVYNLPQANLGADLAELG